MEAVLKKTAKEKELEPLTKSLVKLRTKEQKIIKELLVIKDEIKNVTNEINSING
jgi:hypothetical protein